MDFYYNGKRCREQTALPDTVANRKKVQKLLDSLTEEMSLGSFDYARYFPNSKMLVTLVAVPGLAHGAAIGEPFLAANEDTKPTPLFKDFAETWYSETQVECRHSQCEQIRQILDRMLLPHFGDKAVGWITKADILAFRATLAKTPARGKTSPLSNPRINKILAPLRMILDEAADRYDFVRRSRPSSNSRSRRRMPSPCRWKMCSAS
jgi:integrase